MVQALLNAIANTTVSDQAQRVFHGRGGLYAGCEHWTLDRFPPVWVLTSFLPANEDTERELALIGDALRQRCQQVAPDQPLNWVFQCRNDQLRLEGRVETRLMAGSVPDPHIVQEQGLKFRVHVLKGQNHGLFLDMAHGRQWVGDYVRHCHAQEPKNRIKVLNLFAYTCAFSVVALHAGAHQVVNVDMSRGALSTGQYNHQINGIGQGGSFWAHDIFTSWGKITRTGPYDLVIMDPPSYQKGSFVATKDYARLVRRLPDLLAPSGHAMLCLNAPELGAAFVQEQVQMLAPELTFMERVDNPQVFADTDPERALKVLVFQGAP